MSLLLRIVVIEHCSVESTKLLVVACNYVIRGAVIGAMSQICSIGVYLHLGNNFDRDEISKWVFQDQRVIGWKWNFG